MSVRRNLSILMAVIIVCVLSEPLYISSVDYGNYERLFELGRAIGIGIFNKSRVEPFFGLIIVALASMGLSAPIIYAGPLSLALLVKYNATRYYNMRVGSFVVLILYYLFRYMPLHELTQIRAALAGSFLLYSSATPRKSYAIIAAFLACLTHYSSIAVAPFVLKKHFRHKEFAFVTRETYMMRRVVMLLLFIVLVVLAYFIVSHIDEVLFQASRYFSGLELYVEHGFDNVQVSILSIGILLDLLFVAAVFFWLPKGEGDAHYLSAVVLLSLGMFAAFNAFPILAFRMRELFSVLLIPVVAAMLRGNTKCKSLAMFYVGATSTYYFYVYFLSEAAIFSVLKN